MTSRVNTLSIYNVETFLRYFHGKGLRLLVLRGYQGLPDNYGGDLDVEIPFSQYQACVKELLNFSAMEGLHLFRYVYRPHVTSFKFYRVSSNVLERFILDVTCRGGTWYGFSYLSNEELFAESQDVGVWRIPSTLHELALKVFTNMLIGSSPPEKYFEELAVRLPTIKDNFIKFVNQRFPGVDGQELFSALRDADVQKLRLLIPRLKLALIKKGLRDQPFSSVVLAFKTVMYELYYYLQKNGLKVHLLGDCSKTQECETLLNKFGTSLGHVWKKVTVINDSNSASLPMFHKFVEEFELFRDRLILVHGSAGNLPSNTIALCIGSNVPAQVLHLYQILERRNVRRKGSWLFKNLLWKLAGYRVMIEIMEQ